MQYYKKTASNSCDLKYASVDSRAEASRNMFDCFILAVHFPTFAQKMSQWSCTKSCARRRGTDELTRDLAPFNFSMAGCLLVLTSLNQKDALV